MMINTSKYEQELLSQQYDYNRLQGKIREKISWVKILAIRQVNNKYLTLAFALKEDEMRRQNKTYRIEELIHATGAHKIASILKKNLDWRLVTRSKYGNGVSFSDNAFYANKYCNNRNGRIRAFIFCDVLIGNERLVRDNNDICPVNNADSYRSFDGNVLVKFDDFSYNPKFVVYYQDGVDDIYSPTNYWINDSPPVFNRHETLTLHATLNELQRSILQEQLKEEIIYATPQGDFCEEEISSMIDGEQHRDNRDDNLSQIGNATESSTTRQQEHIQVIPEDDRIERNVDSISLPDEQNERMSQVLFLILLVVIFAVIWMYKK